MTKNKITKRERNGFISALILALGTWMIISPVKEWFNSITSNGATIVIGLVLVLFALWKWRN